MIARVIWSALTNTSVLLGRGRALSVLIQVDIINADKQLTASCKRLSELSLPSLCDALDFGTPDLQTHRYVCKEERLNLFSGVCS